MEAQDRNHNCVKRSADERQGQVKCYSERVRFKTPFPLDERETKREFTVERLSCDTDLLCLSVRTRPLVCV